MLKLKNITKIYGSGESQVQALKEISLEFRKNEFVAILGQSGCGKTTLLNIVGGLDRYTSGDLEINGISTKYYRDNDWDNYRNYSIGFVFQNYNLIPHLNVLDNVAMSLMISGVSAKEREILATEALGKVGLIKELKKRPNQLSGGQMQRVSIARALVNNPDIILADEPTGALDSETGISVMELLKEVAKDRLVIMVTHNSSLADSYTNRIVKLSDGVLIEDTNPYKELTKAASDVSEIKGDKELNVVSDVSKSKSGEELDAVNDVSGNNIDEDNTVSENISAHKSAESKEKNENTRNGKLDNTKKINKKKTKKVAMSFLTALKLSFQNLRTKKGRTLITSIAGSIGIIGVALVLAISSGMGGYVDRMQKDTLSGFPITISRISYDFMFFNMNDGNEVKEYTKENVLYPYDSAIINNAHTNKIDNDYIDYIYKLDKKLYNSISLNRLVEMNLVVATGNGHKQINNGNMLNKVGWQQLPDKEFLSSQYDLLYGDKLPENANEIALVVNKNNYINTDLLEELAISYESDGTLKFEDVVGKTLKVIPNDTFYLKNDKGLYNANPNLEEVYKSDKNIEVKITAVLRVKESSSSSLLDRGLAYTEKLVNEVLDNAKDSSIVKDLQAEPNVNIKTGAPIKENQYTQLMKELGGDSTPVGISIYPVSFDAKDEIKDYLNSFNVNKAEEDRIIYTDLAEDISKGISTMLDAITIVLTAIAAISLVVSTIMIGIIIYVSVVERTKEIGILRSIGARKKDITRVFSAEAIIIGFFAGLIGVVMSYLLSIPINAILENQLQVKNLCDLPPLYAFLLLLLSMALTFVGGIFPSLGAAKKDPVAALRTE